MHTDREAAEAVVTAPRTREAGGKWVVAVAIPGIGALASGCSTFPGSSLEVSRPVLRAACSHRVGPRKSLCTQALTRIRTWNTNGL